METRIRKIAYTSLLTAISIILTRFFAANINVLGVLALRLSFGEVPIILSGILLGPLYGAACGALADIIGYAISPVGGPFFPGFTLTAALIGVVSGLLARYRHNGWKWSSITMLVVATSIISLLLNTLWLSILHGKAYMALLPTRVIGRIFLIPAYIIIIKMVLNYSQQIFALSGSKKIS